MSATHETPHGPRAHLLVCDACCDAAGLPKELIKSGGCTCDICGWACACCRDAGRQFINSLHVRLIGGASWDVLQERNAGADAPLDWQALAALSRRA